MSSLVATRTWHMDNFSPTLTLVFSALIFSYVHDTSAAPRSELVPLWEEAFKHIQFGKIKAKRFTFKDKTLTIELDERASLLMMPFDKVNKVSDVRFQSKSQGSVSTKDAEHENRRDGDDAVFKLGLLLKPDDTHSSFTARIKDIGLR